MIMNPFYDLMCARVKGAIGEAHAAEVISHDGMRGRVREIILSQLITPLLPISFCCVNGVTITPSPDSYAQSEDDILILDKDIMPPFLVSDEHAVVPVEAVLLRVEVKTTLNAEKLERTILQAAHHRGLKLATSSKIVIEGGATGQSIFALKSDLVNEPEKPHKELQRCLDQISKLGLSGDVPPIQSLCVVGSGYWFFYEGGWSYLPSDENFSEVLGFLGVLSNSLPNMSYIRRYGESVANSIRCSRKDGIGGLGAYLIDTKRIEVVKF